MTTEIYDEEKADIEFEEFIHSSLNEKIGHTAFFLTGFPKHVALAVLLAQFGIRLEDSLMWHCPHYICEMAFDIEVQRLQEEENDEE